MLTCDGAPRCLEAPYLLPYVGTAGFEPTTP